MAVTVNAAPVKPAMPITRRRRVKQPEDGFHYRFTRPEKVEERMDDYNYEIVRRTVNPENPLSLEGAVMSGGDVLMRCKKDEYLGREKQREQFAAADLEGPAEGFKMQGIKNAVETINMSKETRGPMSSVLGGKGGAPKDVD